MCAKTVSLVSNFFFFFTFICASMCVSNATLGGSCSSMPLFWVALKVNMRVWAYKSMFSFYCLSFYLLDIFDLCHLLFVVIRKAQQAAQGYIYIINPGFISLVSFLQTHSSLGLAPHCGLACPLADSRRSCCALLLGLGVHPQPLPFPGSDRHQLPGFLLLSGQTRRECKRERGWQITNECTCTGHRCACAPCGGPTL